MGQIRIALPVRQGITVRQARPTVSVPLTEAAMRKRVGEGVANRLRWLRPAREVALLLLRIAPRAARVPMPCLDLKLGVLTIGYWLPSSGKRFLEKRLAQYRFRIPDSEPIGTFQPIYTRTQRAEGTERVHRVGGYSIHDDVLAERG